MSSCSRGARKNFGKYFRFIMKHFKQVERERCLALYLRGEEAEERAA